MSARWQLADVPWTGLVREAVEPAVLAAVKTAALVEANSADYVTYLDNVFAGDRAFLAAVARWGEEEAQHGAALAQWAGMVDPEFDFAASLAHFRAGYRLPLGARDSVRGSRTGELLARCVVESGTCSFYAALRDRTREPVLKYICHRIAQDEARHYRLFQLHYARHLRDTPLWWWRRLRIALGRVGETDDDELAHAYFSANHALAPNPPTYRRRQCGRAYQRLATGLYGERHVRTVVAMIAQALGVNPMRWPVRAGGRLAWWWLRARQPGDAAI